MVTRNLEIPFLALPLAALWLGLSPLQEVRGAGFVEVSPMNRARNFHTATLLLNGKVLVAGGFDLGARAELYDPATDTWTATGSLRASRVYHAATLLPNGKVLVAGATQSGGAGAATATTELYDPATGTWAFTGRMARARVFATLTLLPNGKVVIIEGAPGLSELYDPDTGTWMGTASPTGAGGAYHPPTLLLNGKVLMGGELYDPATGTWTNTAAPSRSYLTATLLLNGKVLAAGGNRTYSAELYDPDTGTWSATGSLTWDRDFCRATLLRNGKVLVTGGYQQPTDTPIASAELYDPATGTWAEIPMNSAHFSHTATLLENGKVLVAGGSGSVSDAELYEPDEPLLTVERNADQTATLTWTGAGTLEQAQTAIAPNWQAAPSQANPQTIHMTGFMKLYRVKSQ